MNETPHQGANSPAASPFSNSSFVGPLRAVKKKSLLKWLTAALLFFFSTKPSLIEKKEWAAGKENKLISFFFEWGPQPNQKEEIKFSFL